MPSVPFQKQNLLRRTDDDHHLLRRTDDDDPLLAADLHRPYRLEHWADGRRTDDDDPVLAADLHRPYRLEHWVDGISDVPHCHSNSLQAGLDFPPFHHFAGPFATFLPSGP